jgi:nucleoid-associated protein YgaU
VSAVRVPITAAAIAIATLAGGVSAARAEDYDLEAGDYLTIEEYGKLSKDEALEYCQRLAQEIDIQTDNASAANERMAEIDEKIVELRAGVAEARGAADPLAAEVSELERRLRELQERPNSHTVAPGETLRRIAGYPEVYGDREQWHRLYEANRDRIPDPNRVPAGTELTIPR